MATSPRFGINILTGTETPDIPRDLNAIKDRLETVGAVYMRGTFGARPTASAANAGMFYQATDADRATVAKLYFSTGTAWIIPEPLVRIVTDLASPGFSPIDDDVVEFGFTYANTHAVYWRLRYASVNAHKWLPQGCVPLVFTPSGDQTTGGLVTVAGPAASLPAPGLYRISVSLNVGSTGGGGVSTGQVGVNLRNGSGVIIGSQIIGSVNVSGPTDAFPSAPLLHAQFPVTVSVPATIDVTGQVTLGGSALRFAGVCVTVEPLELGA